MLLAQECDAVADGEAYPSTERRRIFTPDTRARLYGYLTTAPVAAPGFRTDGVWVWPERLAEHVRACGAAPQEQFYEHLRERYFLLPEAIGEEALWEAARAATGPAVPDPAPWQQWAFLAAHADPQAPPSALLRVGRSDDGSVLASQYYADGWDSSHLYREVREGRSTQMLVPITARQAAALNDRLANDTHARLLRRSRESEPRDALLRLARVFDGHSPTGTPWFSPARLRLPEAVRRERIAAYLRAGRLVVRATGLMADPLTGGSEPVVPLNFRTDGTWVWQEALAYYLLSRGAAPELEFLCHIEERGYRPRDDVSDDVASAAAALASATPPPPLPQVAVTYYREPGGRVVCRARRGEYFDADAYRMDRRWGGTSVLAVQFLRGGSDEFEPVPEADAVHTIDARWAADDAQPPFD